MSDDLFLSVEMARVAEVGTQTDLHCSTTDLPVTEQTRPDSSRATTVNDVLELNVGGALISVSRATLTQVRTSPAVANLCAVCYVKRKAEILMHIWSLTNTCITNCTT